MPGSSKHVVNASKAAWFDEHFLAVHESEIDTKLTSKLQLHRLLDIPRTKNRVGFFVLAGSQTALPTDATRTTRFTRSRL